MPDDPLDGAARHAEGDDTRAVRTCTVRPHADSSEALRTKSIERPVRFSLACQRSGVLITMTWIDFGSGVQEIEAASADELVALLRRSNDAWWDGSWCPWVFRGQANESWPLLPSAWRPGHIALDAARRVMEQRSDAGGFSPELRWNTGNWVSGRADFGSNADVLARKLAIEAAAEVALVYDFAHTANALGLALPVTGQLPPDPNAADWFHAANEPLLGDDLLRWQHLPELLSLAQHHRVPTRLPTAAAPTPSRTSRTRVAAQGGGRDYRVHYLGRDAAQRAGRAAGYRSPLSGGLRTGG